MTRILIADDHTVVRRGLGQIINETLDLQVTGEAASGGAVLRMTREATFDVVVLDLNLPDSSGLDILKQLKAEHPKLPVVVLSVHGEDEYGVRVMRAGASGYLTKESAPAELIKALRRAAEGRKYVSPTMAETLLNHFDPDDDLPPHAHLSDREFQVLRLLACGRSVTEIAERFSLSAKTISTYRSKVLEKMNMSSNAELAQYALRHDLLD